MLFRSLKNLKKRGRSQERFLDDSQSIVRVRSDSSEPMTTKEMKLNTKARESLPQNSIKGMMYTNEIERVLHEFKVTLYCKLVHIKTRNGFKVI